MVPLPDFHPDERVLVPLSQSIGVVQINAFAAMKDTACEEPEIEVGIGEGDYGRVVTLHFWYDDEKLTLGIGNLHSIEARALAGLLITAAQEIERRDAVENAHDFRDG